MAAITLRFSLVAQDRNKWNLRPETIRIGSKEKWIHS
jgi:hypothetical protein